MQMSFPACARARVCVSVLLHCVQVLREACQRALIGAFCSSLSRAAKPRRDDPARVTTRVVPGNCIVLASFSVRQAGGVTPTTKCLSSK